MRKFFGVFILFLLIIFSAKTASGAEGTFELRSTDSNGYKCFAASLQQQNLNYKVLVSCRNIIFPVDDTIYTYVLWANPQDGSSAIKLGSIGLGRAEFILKPAFTSLFITAEQNPSVKTPAGNVVMKGSIKPITFLEKQITSANQETTDQESASTVETPSPTPAGTSVRDRLLTGLKRAGLASGLALVAILGLVFVLTRPR